MRVVSESSHAAAAIAALVRAADERLVRPRASGAAAGCGDFPFHCCRMGGCFSYDAFHGSEP